ncbi:MAG: AAC(3)-I family aminoglycoside N-acetyltransferase, partial [Rhodospirillales bacterium]|nr:AAC(3)-I family aminoglycoside N-acetyltransferase [Rhodospirillales bacterium]
FAVRQLTKSDLPAMTELLEVFAKAFEEPEAYRSATPGEAYLRRLLAKDHFIVLVAVKDGAVIGGLAAYELEKFEQERSEIYIYDLAVTDPHRRQGIATALIEDLKRIAAERGAWVIFVQADHGDEPAIRLYDKLGVREEVLHFDIAVERTEPSEPMLDKPIAD